MTHTDIRDAIKSNLGRSDASANTAATAAADRAQISIEQELNWWWMEQTQTAALAIAPTSPRDRVSLPADWKELRDSPHYTGDSNDRIALLPVGEDEANARWATDEKGDPSHYRLWKGQMFIYPPDRTTARTLRMPYWAWSAAITGTATNELSIRWPNLWIARGTVEYALALRDLKLADYWMGDPRKPRPGCYLWQMAQAKKDENRRRVPRALRLRTGALPGPSSQRKRWLAGDIYS